MTVSKPKGYTCNCNTVITTHSNQGLNFTKEFNLSGFASKQKVSSYQSWIQAVIETTTKMSNYLFLVPLLTFSENFIKSIHTFFLSYFTNKQTNACHQKHNLLGGGNDIIEHIICQKHCERSTFMLQGELQVTQKQKNNLNSLTFSFI